MTISVIVPVYKCQDYLKDCLDSILAQTYSDLQIILIDDGSPDESGAICDAYAKRDDRITVLHQSNQGVSAARNAGLSIATGDAISFVDSDDTIDMDMYEILSSLMLTHNADVAICGYKKIYFDGSQKNILGTNNKIEMDGMEACRNILTGTHFTGSPWTKLYRRQLIASIRFDPELSINEDILMNIQVFQRCKKIVFLDVCKYNYFERSQSATRVTDSLKIKRDCVVAVQKMLNILQSTKLAGICAGRLRYTLIDLYRTGLLIDPPISKQEQYAIHTQYKHTTQLAPFNLRASMNYFFMRYFPRVYAKIYRLYQAVHTQDNDI